MPTILVLLAGVMWSFSGVLIKGIHWNPLAMAGVRSLIGGSLQFAFLIWCLHRSSPASPCWSIFDSGSAGLPPALSLVGLAARTLRRVFAFQVVHWLGALSFLLNMISLVFAFKLTNVATAVFLHYSGIVLVALLSRPILKQPLSKVDWIAVVVALAGVGILTVDGAQLHGWPGVMLGAFCGITMATTQICLGLRAKKSQTGMEALETIFLANMLMAIIAAPSIVFALPELHGNQCWLLLILGIVPWGVPDILYALGIKQVPMFRAMVLGLSDPVLTAVWPILFLGEAPSVVALVGAGAVLAAIVYQARHTAMLRRSLIACIGP